MATQNSDFLRAVLLADAATCLLGGVALVLAAAPLSGWLGLPVPLLVGAGLALLPIGAFMAWVGGWALQPRFVRLVAVDNVLWGAACLGLLASSAVAPTALGEAFLVLQAAVVLTVAWLEARGATRLATALPA